MFSLIRNFLLGASVALACISACKAQIGSGVTQLIGIDITEQQLAEFLQEVRKLRLGEDGPDEVVEQIGPPRVREKEGDRKRWKYSFILGMPNGPTTDFSDYDNAYQVNAIMEIGTDGRLASVQVERLRSGEVEILYRQGQADGGSAAAGPAVCTSHPENPPLGSIYHNSSDDHFYGWNGCEWKRLDN
jgi:hypothetical protein